MSIVELNGNLIREFPPGALGLLETTDNVVEGGSYPEVLLLETELLSTIQIVIGIQDGADRLGTLLVCHRALVLSGVELLEVEFSAGSLAGPQSQVVCGCRCVPRNGNIVGYSFDSLAALPVSDGLSGCVLRLVYIAIELDLVINISIYSEVNCID